MLNLKKINFWTLALLVSLAGISCNTNPSGFTLEGTVENADNLRVFLDKAESNNTTTVITQGEIDNTGHFEISTEEPLAPGVYRLRIGTAKVPLILDGSERKVEMKGNLSDMTRGEYEITGAPATAEYNQAMSDYYNRKMDVSEIQEFIKNAENPFVSMQFALQTLGARPDFLELHKEVSNKLQKEYPDHDYTKDYAVLVQNLEQQQSRRMAEEKIQVGQPAPNIELPSPDGTVYELEDLKGKVVLLDFWASWCGPCRKANPHVVETYKKYKDKGFTVFSVSLDGLDSRTKRRFGSEEMIEQQMERSKQRWVQAIEKDNLMWDYHVSDLRKWESQPAQTYGVRSIPKTFLIDRDGKIAAINPRYNLEEELNKLL